MAMQNLIFMRTEALGYTLLLTDNGDDILVRVAKIIGTKQDGVNPKFRIFSYANETNFHPPGSKLRYIHKPEMLKYATEGGCFDFAMRLAIKSTPDAPQALMDYIKEGEANRKA